MFHQFFQMSKIKLNYEADFGPLPGNKTDCCHIIFTHLIEGSLRGITLIMGTTLRAGRCGGKKQCTDWPTHPLTFAFVLLRNGVILEAEWAWWDCMDCTLNGICCNGCTSSEDNMNPEEPKTSLTCPCMITHNYMYKLNDFRGDLCATILTGNTKGLTKCLSSINTSA